MLSVRQFLILDAVGATVSVIMLGIVLVRLQSFFGIPVSALKVLASIPAGFFIFDMLAIFSKDSLQPGRLMTIGILNILYCVLSLVLAILHSSSLTIYGWAYIIIEILIVVLLGIAEVKKGRKYLQQFT